jgi:hypothetical protein
MELPVTSGPTDPVDEPTAAAGGGRQRIDPITRLLVLRLKEVEPERSAANIAAVIGGISEGTVRRLLAGHTADTKVLTKALMQMTVTDRLENWERACEVAAEKGYHQPTKDYLEAAQAVDSKPQVSANVNVAPTVVLTMPFQLGALTDYKPPPQKATAIEALAVLGLPSTDSE